MNRTVSARVKASHYEDLESLKALRWRAPFQAICDAWTKDPESTRSIECRD